MLGGNDRQSGNVTKLLQYPVAADAPRAPERFRSMLFDGWDDYTYGVMRTEVLRRTRLHGSHHFADRTINTELALHGPFYHGPGLAVLPPRASRAGEPAAYTVRTRCAYMDPRRADRLRHPVVRLYGEYIWGYVAADPERAAVACGAHESATGSWRGGWPAGPCRWSAGP